MNKTNKTVFYGRTKVSINEKRKNITKIFTDISKNYDKMNDIMSLGTHRLWKKDLVNRIGYNLPNHKNSQILDIAGGTVDSIADILKNLSKDNVNQTSINQLDKTLGSGSKKPSNIFAIKQPEPDESSGVIQKPITSDKSNWCLVGEYEGKRGCVEVNEASKCLSGQTFPTLQMCMHPTKAVYMHSHAAA